LHSHTVSLAQRSFGQLSYFGTEADEEVGAAEGGSWGQSGLGVLRVYFLGFWARWRNHGALTPARPQRYEQATPDKHACNGGPHRWDIEIGQDQDDRDHHDAWDDD
jgi:hypothetical protein